MPFEHDDEDPFEASRTPRIVQVSRGGNWDNPHLFREFDHDGPPEVEIHNPTRETVLQWLTEQDGFKFNAMYVELEVMGERAECFVEAGGEDTGLSVREPGAGLVLHLVDLSKSPDEDVDIWSGGVDLDRPADVLHPLEVIRPVLEYFLDTGLADPTRHWRYDIDDPDWDPSMISKLD